MNDINNLGSFSSIDAVWAKYPEGGKEGDFLTIGGVKHRWNKYDQIWENANTVTSSTARKLETVEGDLSVNNDLIVGGVLRAKAVKQPNCGLFESLSALQAKYPNPEVGMWATVGNTIPATVYLCAEEGVWKNTGQTGGIDSLDWSRISTIESNVTTLQQENTNRKTEIAKIDSSLRTLIATTVGKKLKFAPFAGFVSNVEIIKAGTSQWNNIVWDTVHKKFLACVLAPSDGDLHLLQFYDSWTNQNDYTDDFVTPTQYSIFHNTLTGDIYRYDGTDLVSLGITAERFNELSEKIKELQAKDVAEIGSDGKLDSAIIPDAFDEIIPVNYWMNNRTASTEIGQLVVTPIATEGAYWYAPNTKELFRGESYGVAGQYKVSWMKLQADRSKLYLDLTNCLPYIWKGGDMVAIAPKNTPASIFNATTEVPISGYYVLCDSDNESMSAIHAAWKDEKAVSGLIVSFELSAGIWKTYQYVGKTVTENNWFDTDNWKDFGSLAAGSETHLVIDELCGTPTGGAYTLGSAVDALIAYQQKTGVNYAKRGLVISYKTGENEMETKQFQGEISDFKEVGLWKDFGGGGKLTAKDTLEKGGEDALSTGGGYNLIPTNLKVDTETEGVIKVAMVNSAGDTIGDEQQFAVGTGSGGGSGTIIAVQWKENPLYEKAGGTFIAEASIMSVTKVGSMENYNSIMKVAFANRTTKKTVATFEPKKASSASNEDFSFSFDLSSLGTSAGEIPLQAVITDDSGNTATKNLSLIAVDVTCVSVQTLNYTKDTSLEVNGNAKNIPMFKFPNNSSDKGILTKVEMYRDGEWKLLQSITVSDTYSHGVLINPAGLSHGAYAIRIQGEDVSSGVKGNVLHTSVMVIQQDDTLSDYNTPIVLARWSDGSNGKKKLLESIDIDVACYQRNLSVPTVEIELENATQHTKETIGSKAMNRNQTYTISKRLTTYNQGDELKVRAKCGSSVQPEDCVNTVEGSLVDISETAGALFDIDMTSRSNTDTDKRIVATTSDGKEVEIFVKGSNYSSNGFVKDSYGTSDYGTDADKGRMALRIAEDVTATSNIKPYSNSAIETNGSALTFTTQVKNVADRNTVLMKCAGEKMGFVLTGEKLVVYTNGDTTDGKTSCTVPYSVNAVHRFDIVVEPTSIAPFGGIGMIKVFKDGDEAGAVPYVAGQFAVSEAVLEWDGTDADIYLYSLKMWNTYYTFKQAFDNYLVGLTDTEAMISEYEKNDVLVSQKAEGVTKDMPSMQKCLDAGLCVVVLTKNADTADVAENYPDHLESLDGDKKTTFLLDWYVYFPDRPWQNVIITADPTSNQGTTSSFRPIKNKKAKHKKNKGGMRMMYTREEIAAMFPGNEEVLAKYDLAASMAKKNKLQVREGGQYTDISTIKVDYSDSCGAHNGAMMELMNDTQIAMGEKYMTPAQIYSEGDFKIMTSIDSIPCALFRTDHQMSHTDACDPAKAYFHAKGNFNADKGDATFYGFQKVKGYNASCLNYGDFKEIVTTKEQSLSDLKQQVLSDTSKLVAGTIYVLSEWCGDKYHVIENDGSGKMEEVGAVDKPTETVQSKAELLATNVSELDWGTVYKTSDGYYMQYKGGKWIETTGTMTFNKQTNKWSVTGRVVNPVECYELLKYDYLNWMQGVNSVEDMMRVDESSGKPIWMSYYESRYPDDDDLNEKYEAGEKVPYRLYKWLSFCQQCNHHLTESDGDITINGDTVSGSTANRLAKWEKELHKEANVLSALCYTVASDYKASVDQRSKNMMIAFYLDTDGRVRMYLNHWYDGDCVDGSDNDCGLTIPWDMDARTSHLYQGWDSVLFQQTYKAGAFWLDDEGSSTVTLSQVAGAMRSVTYNNIKPFSASGCYYYWVTKRLEKWAKVISSFDGERKYVQNSKASDQYFYALHGLRLDDLPDYQRKRFEFCDGQYQVGDLYTNPFKARMMGKIEITITAAQDGFFGLGEDRADMCADSCHLLAGESYTMRVSDAQESGKMIYIFGASKLAKLDISKCTPKSDGFSLEYCTLLEELIVGGEAYSPAYTTGLLTGLNLPTMPFLKRIDIRNTKIAVLSAKNCPRLKEVLAEGSSLKTFTPAESAPISVLHLPSTMTSLQFVNLPLLTYPNGGLTIGGMSDVTRFEIRGCDKIDTMTMLKDAISGGARIAEISCKLGNVRSDTTLLQSLIDSGARGIGSELKDKCDGLTGRYILTQMIEQSLYNTYKNYFPELELHNALYSQYTMSDLEPDPQNITNEDNKTGYKYKNKYVPSGYINIIRRYCVPVQATPNRDGSAVTMKLLKKCDNTKYHDGTDYDYTDNLGQGFDSLARFCHFWYKGINDIKVQEKHILLNYGDEEPVASWTEKASGRLAGLIYRAGVGISLNSVTVGQPFTEEMMSSVASCAVYRIDVRGMKQVRYYGLNNALFGGVFLGDDDVVIEKAQVSVTGTAMSPLDFLEDDYLFRDVPSGAKWFYFTCLMSIDQTKEVFAVDSDDIEAIEPGWVEHKADLVGIYGMSVDDLVRARSLSGKKTRCGNGTQTTSIEWSYDDEGNPTSTPVGAMNYTYQDMLNLCRMRGKGYHSISYEQSKILAILSLCWSGNRDDQSVYGFGCGSQYTTGSKDKTGMDTINGVHSGANKVWNVEGAVACNYEVMDFYGVNISTFKEWKASKRSQVGPVDGNAHIYDPHTDTERVVPYPTQSGYNIARIRLGRFCDIIASSVNNDTSKWVTCFCAVTYYSGAPGRCVGRASVNAIAYGGLVYSNAAHASSYSYSYLGVRLAFSGILSNDAEIDKLIENNLEEYDDTKKQ